MARVLISYKARYSDCLYQDIEKVLLKEGNDVLLINWADRSDTNLIISVDSSKEHLTERIIEFAPDLVFNFNNSCPYATINMLNCPILVFEADMPYLETYVSGQNLIRKLLENEHIYYIGTDSASKEVLDKYLGYTFDENRFLHLPLATEANRVERPLLRNIFFCGANWYEEFFDIIKSDELYSDFKKLYEIHKKEHGWQTLIQKSEKNTIFISGLFFHFAGQERLRYLNQLTDLGLEVYGRYWESAGYAYDMELAELCKNQPITDATIQEYYNSSKISVNFSHPQAINSFSFRVMDIMASSSCVLTEDKKDWHMLFDNYVSKEVQDAIIYKDRFDMRDKAIRLLNDEPFRQRCVAECNNAIEQNGRWKSRLYELQEFINIQLIGVGEPIPQGIEYLYDEANRPDPNAILHKPKKIKFKNFTNGLVLMLLSLPLFDKIFSEKAKHKLLKSILKYNDKKLYGAVNKRDSIVELFKACNDADWYGYKL